jgi:hypothetical protein
MGRGILDGVLESKNLKRVHHLTAALAGGRSSRRSHHIDLNVTATECDLTERRDFGIVPFPRRVVQKVRQGAAK